MMRVLLSLLFNLQFASFILQFEMSVFKKTEGLNRPSFEKHQKLRLSAARRTITGPAPSG